MKMKTIFEIPTIKTLELMYHMFFIVFFSNFCRYGGGGSGCGGQNGKIATFRCSTTKNEPPYHKSARSINKCGHCSISRILGTSAPNVS